MSAARDLPGDGGDPRPHAPGLMPIAASSRRGFGGAWLAGIGLALAAFVLLSLAWINDYSDPESAWINYLYRQKHVAMVRRSSCARRLVVVGGSGALFGIDAQLIERKLGIPCVNYATHAGLGLRYILHRARRELRPGDMVLLAPEYGAWLDSYRDEPGPGLSFIRTYDKPYLAQMSVFESAKIIGSAPLSDWRKSWQGWRDYYQADRFHLQEMSFYNYGLVDPNGDLRVLMDYRAPVVRDYSFPQDPKLPAVAEVRAFGAFCRERGIGVFFSWPNFLRPDVPAEAARPPDWLSDLLDEQGFAVLNTPIETTYPQAWFMDSFYHVNPCCRRLRTEDLIRRLRPRLGMPAAPPEPSGLYLVAGRDCQLTGGNLFATDPGMQVRYLQEADYSSFGGITPAQVAQRVAAGTAVYTDSSDATPLLARAGLGRRLASREVMTVEQWFSRYPNNIFCLAAAPRHPMSAAWKQILPSPLFDRLQSGDPVVSVFGSGRFRRALDIVSNDAQANGFIHLEILTGHARRVMPMIIATQAWSAKGGGEVARFFINSREMLSSPTGICIGAIDPDMGILLDRMVFSGEDTVQTWRLDQVVPAAAAAGRGDSLH